MKPIIDNIPLCSCARETLEPVMIWESERDRRDSNTCAPPVESAREDALANDMCAATTQSMFGDRSFCLRNEDDGVVGVSGRLRAHATVLSARADADAD